MLLPSAFLPLICVIEDPNYPLERNQRLLMPIC